MSDDYRKHLKVQGERAIAHPPSAVGQHQARGPGYIDGEYSVVQPEAQRPGATIDVSAGKAPKKEAGRKIGEGHAPAMVRLGFKELAAALPAFPGGQQIQDDPGLYGNATQQEASEQKGLERGDRDKGSVHGKAEEQGNNLKEAGVAPVEGERVAMPQTPGMEQTQSRGRSR